MKIFKNTLQLLIILVLISYIIYGKINHEESVSYQFDLKPGYQVYTFDIPTKLDFAGEEVPLEDIDVRERFDREIHINTYWNSSTVFTLKRAERWLPQIAEVLKENGLPEDFKYLAVIESGLLNVQSPRGASGFWQLMEATGKELGLEVNEEVDERYNPLKSTAAASKYLKKAYRRFGNYTSAAASYNMGMLGLNRRLEEQKVGSYYDLLLNEETSRYVFRVLALKEIMEHPAKYGYIIPRRHLYEEEPVDVVEVDSTINDLVAFAASHNINYKILKQYNPWLRKNTLTIKSPGKVYEIKIPKNPPSFVPYMEDTVTINKDSLTADVI